MKTSSKTFLTILCGISLALLVIVCAVMIGIAWNAMNTAERLEKENRRLLLENNACNIRLQNADLKEGYTPTAPAPVQPLKAIPEAAPAPQAPLSVPQAAPKTEPATEESKAPVAAPEAAPEQKKTSEKSSNPEATQANPSPEVTAVSSPSVKDPLPAITTQTNANAEASAAADLPASPRKNAWYVQLGAFTSKKHATHGLEMFDRTLKEKEQSIELQISKSRKYYKILTQAAMSKSEALALAEAIRNGTALDAVVVRYRRR